MAVHAQMIRLDGWPANGYCSAMDASRIKNPFFPPDAPGAVVCLSETESTMADARRAAESGVSGIVIAADYQTAGRARGTGRVWLCPPGEGLLFTLVLKTDRRTGAWYDRVAAQATRPEILPLLAGLALSRTLESCFGLEPRIKWPNDVLLDGRKLAGILCEFFSGYVLLGMGINVGPGAVPPVGEQRTPATALAEHGVVHISREELLSAALAAIHSALELKDWRIELERRLYRMGERVRFRPGAAAGPMVPLVVGTLAGVDAHGQIILSLEKSGVRRAFPAGELILDDPDVWRSGTTGAEDATG